MTDVVTKRLAIISNNGATASGIQAAKADIRSLNISILRTLPVHRAPEIQHDVESYLRNNAMKFGPLAQGNLSYLPAIDEIATPIYIVSLFDKSDGRIAYVGKAASKKNRFQGGHAALLKLLDPKYNAFEKYISFAIINVLAASHPILPIEWLSPRTLRSKIISHIEHALVWKFQPELNSQLKTEQPADLNCEINFDSYSDETVQIDGIRVRAAGQPIVQALPRICKV